MGPVAARPATCVAVRQRTVVQREACRPWAKPKITCAEGRRELGEAHRAFQLDGGATVRWVDGEQRRKHAGEEEGAREARFGGGEGEFGWGNCARRAQRSSFELLNGRVGSRPQSSGEFEWQGACACSALLGFTLGVRERNEGLQAEKGGQGEISATAAPREGAR